MFSGKRQLSPWVFMVSCLFVAMVRAGTSDVTPDSTRDTLVYKDGDRVRGHLIKKTPEVIIFKSDRFGELRVPSADAVVIPAEKPHEPVAKPVVASGIKSATVTPEEEKEEQERVSIWERFSPAVLTARVREFFGPWHGRVAISNDMVTDTTRRDAVAIEGRLSRKLTKDSIEMTARYDHDETDGVLTTDLFKANGSWRHDFTGTRFSQYRPTLEWNRANTRRRGGLPVEYVLVQQEYGLGVTVWSTPARKFRVGVSENLFDVWGYDTPEGSHNSKAVASLFEEVEFAMPWRLTLVQRGVWYPESPAMQGFEDQVELSKKLTETLSLSIRHEIRRNNTDGAAPDYTRLKVLLGLDF